MWLLALVLFGVVTVTRAKVDVDVSLRESGFHRSATHLRESSVL
jgi:hypothetical protein